MSEAVVDLMAYCGNCGGAVQGPIPEGQPVPPLCGAAASGHPEIPAEWPRTDCVGLHLRGTPDPFKTRVAALLREIEWEGGVANPFNNGWCPACEAPSEHKMEMSRHEDNCALAALLREAEGKQ